MEIIQYSRLSSRPSLLRTRVPAIIAIIVLCLNFGTVSAAPLPQRIHTDPIILIDPIPVRETDIQAVQLTVDLQPKQVHVPPKKAAVQPVYAPGDCESWMVAAGITDLVSARKLIAGESGCNPTVWNKQGSGACGIPQALPCSKMKCPLTNAGGVCQLQWMDAYIKSRYGTWANAYATWLSRSPHWY